MVDFKILLRYRGNQQSANTITKQKTVFATSRLLKIKQMIQIKMRVKGWNGYFHKRLQTYAKKYQVNLINDLLSVVA